MSTALPHGSLCQVSPYRTHHAFVAAARTEEESKWEIPQVEHLPIDRAKQVQRSGQKLVGTSACTLLISKRTSMTVAPWVILARVRSGVCDGLLDHNNLRDRNSGGA
jgi:hypothetical protein